LAAAIGERGGVAAGTVAYEGVNPDGGTATIGHVVHTPLLQGTRAATEAHWLMLERLFSSGYRRVAWSCDAHNADSVRAARRLGFAHEATKRYVGVRMRREQRVSHSHTYLSILGHEWPSVSSALRGWLDPANFDAAGVQKQRLSELTAALRPEGKIHRVDLDFGSTLTVCNRDSQSNCWVNWKIMGQPYGFQVSGSSASLARPRTPQASRSAPTSSVGPRRRRRRTRRCTAGPAGSSR
jgi:hypothetical protein